MPPKRPHDYTRTSVEVRKDLFFMIKKLRWNVREILEEALLAKTTPEDVAYVEAARLEKELEKTKKTLEETKNDMRGVRI